MDAPHARMRFEKVVSNVDLQKLSFPSALRAHVWGPNDPHGTVRFFPVVDSNGGHWLLKGRMRVDPNGNRKPEVSGDEWRRLVHEKGLRVLDKLVFYRNPHGDHPLFRVAVSRWLPPVTIRLFGANIQNQQYEKED